MKENYNERLFKKSRLRRYYHLARFEWFRALAESGTIKTNKILELGCFDGRLIDYCLTNPENYIGIDANVEGGLDLARQRFRGRSDVYLIESDNPSVLNSIEGGSFDTVVALETLEHIDPSLIQLYIAEAARICCGHFIFSVPNEKGVIFLLKYFLKTAIFGGEQKYTAAEVWNAAIGRLGRVKRCDHKGFDYSVLLSDVSRNFEILSIIGLPFSFLPPRFNLTVAVMARPRSAMGA